MATTREQGDRLAIGRLGSPHGLRGDLKVRSYSGEYEHFFGLQFVDLASEGRSLRLKVLRVEENGDAITMAFEGYPSPEAARALTGMDIVVSRAQAAPLRQNEWYVTDLVGLAVTVGGSRVGTLRSVLEGGAEPWLETLLPDGRSALIPFRKEFVGEVDLEKGSVELLAPWILE